MNTVSSGRGRKMGSTSFVVTTVGNLVDQLGTDAEVVLSRRFMSEVGLTGRDIVGDSKTILSLAKAAKPATVEAGLVEA